MATTSVILGAGGQFGMAWEIGYLRGLAEKGLDLRDPMNLSEYLRVHKWAQFSHQKQTGKQYGKNN